MNRREALAVMGGVVIAGKLPASPSNEFIITCRCDDARQTRTVIWQHNFTEFERAVSKVTWWPDGNTQGVYESVEWRGVKHNLYGFDSIVCPSIYRGDNGKWAEFEAQLNDRYTFRMNRYYICIDDSVNRYIATGGSVGFPTGINGRQWLNGKEVMFGKTINHSSCPVVPFGRFSYYTPLLGEQIL